jgi:hypothetical protein
MKLTEDERKNYDQKISDIVMILTSNGAEARQLFASAEALAREMLPDEPTNVSVLSAVKSANLVFTVSELKRAMGAHFRTVLRKAEWREVLGVEPANERQYVAAFMALRQYDLDYHREFTAGADKTPIPVEDIVYDARLTAADLDMIKPRGDLLSVVEIGHALAEWANMRRRDRKEAAAQQVATLSADRDKATIDAAFTQVCQWYFPEGEAAFAEAAARKFIWSVKRRLLRLPIKHVHMLCLVGPQDTGKTKFVQTLYSPLDELAIEVSLADILDTRQMDMPSYYVAFTDEMAFAENARPAQLKTFLNGGTPSRRPMKTNISEKIAINVTVIATANHSLDKLIYDSSGMRRFVEIKPRKRPEIEPYWDQIMAFDWMGLWQSIDATDEADPLVSKFREQLMAKQEAIRNLDNTEMWLKNFDADEYHDFRRRETSTPDKWEWFAQDLYARFRVWEETYDPAFRGTSLQRWGREMRSLIDNGRITQWTWKMVQNKTVYSKEMPIKAEQNAVIPLVRPTRTSKN